MVASNQLSRLRNETITFDYAMNPIDESFARYYL